MFTEFVQYVLANPLTVSLYSGIGILASVALVIPVLIMYTMLLKFVKNRYIISFCNGITNLIGFFMKAAFVICGYLCTTGLALWFGYWLETQL